MPTTEKITTPRAGVTGIVPSKKNLLPPFYQTGQNDFMARAQRKDTEFRHRWVNISPRNQHMKLYKGWKPLEDVERLKALGVGNLIHANGRARWMDTELWVMPMEVYRLVRETINQRTSDQSRSQREALDAMAEDVKGRTRGMVQPYVSKGTAGVDVIDRIPVAAPTAKP